MASPFFLVGSGRCGATWLWSIIREHPRIAMSNEARVLDVLYFCNELVNVPSDKSATCVPMDGVALQGIVREECMPVLSPIFLAHCKEICEEFYRERFREKAFDWWGDKLPDPRVALGARYLWPDVRYVLLVRDPRDVLCSWRQWARRPDVRALHPELDMEAPVLARSWKSIYGGFPNEVESLFVLRYEDAIARPLESVRALLAHLELDVTSEIEAAIAANDSFGIHGTSPTLESTIERWRSELPAADAALIAEVCGDTMRGYGYVV
ncbi:MAG: sulfotransferase [Planctomycetes bacterium]|nr:sulfotransferase [Planctomycetota bacterium]